MAVGGTTATRWTAGVLAASIVLVATVAVVASGTEPTGAAAPHPSATSHPANITLSAFYQPPAHLTDAPAGTLVRKQALAIDRSLPAGTRSWRIVFHSRTASGRDLIESGMVVVPGGTPPPGGFPIVSWAHGTTGVASNCAPSRSGTGSIPGLRTMVAKRMIVAAADYRGLGVAGLHPYLVGKAEGEDVLDAARAARHLAGSAASDAVVVAGFSQGGQAALFAGELASSYAPDLFVAGVAAIAPVTSVLDLAPTGNTPPPSGQSAFSASVLWSWAHLYPSVKLASVLTPAGLADLDVVQSSCIDQVASVYDPAPPDRFFQPGWQRTAGVVAANRANSPGSAPTTSPVLIVQGTADEVIPFGRTTQFVADRLCRTQYDAVDFVTLPGTGHAQTMEDATSILASWITQRLEGVAMEDSCSTGVLGAAN